MSDNELEKIRLRKAEMLLKLQSMPKEIINIYDEDEFNDLLKDFPEKVMVIDFWANWCAPCKVFTPIFERAYQEYSKDFIFIKVNVDETPMIAQHFRITSIPTTLFVKRGEILRKFAGVVSYEILKQILEKFKL